MIEILISVILAPIAIIAFGFSIGVIIGIFKALFQNNKKDKSL